MKQRLVELDFKKVENAQYFQWIRVIPRDPIDIQLKLDLLVGPLGEFKEHLKTNKLPRVRPESNIKLHAHLTDEAIGIDGQSEAVPIVGKCIDGSDYEGTIYIPQAFTYLLMKLYAFSDRKHDAASTMQWTSIDPSV